MFNPKQKFKENLEAIELSFQIQKEGRKASPEEIDTLKKYNGFGGLKVVLMPLDKVETWSKSDQSLIEEVKKLHQILDQNTSPLDKKEFMNSVKSSILTSFYTEKGVVDSIASAFKDKGVQIESLLDPSAGAGQFIESFTEENPNIKATAFEKDKLTSHILKGIYAGKSEINGLPFEEIGTSKNGYFDIATSNIPFGDFAAFDPNYVNSKDKVKQQSCRAIHNYFFVKGLDQVREGGIVAFITSTGVADSPTNEAIRNHLVKNANLVSIVRLPNNTFKENANTEVASDLIILQKNSNKKILSKFEKDFIKSENSNGYNWNSAIQLDRIIHTSGGLGTDMYGKPAMTFKHDGGIEGIAADLKRRITIDIENNFIQDHFYANRKIEEPKQTTLFNITQGTLFSNQPKEIDFNQNDTLSSQPLIEGTLAVKDGNVGILKKKDEGWKLELRGFSHNQTEMLKSYINVRDSYLKLSSFEEESQKENKILRNELNANYDSFRSRFGALNEKKNIDSILFDSYSREIVTIEKVQNREYVKSDIFREPTSFQKAQETYSTNDALASSLNKFGKVDLNYISTLSGKKEEELLTDLKGKILFNASEGLYENRDKFLSGDILKKISETKEYLVNNDHSPATESLKELEKIIPEKIPFEVLVSDINLGERWIPNEIYSEYATKLFNTKTDVTFVKSIDSFNVEAKYSNEIIRTEYAVQSNGRNYNGLYLLDHALKNTLPEFSYKIDDKYYLDSKAIQLAATKIDKIREGFTDYLKEIPAEKKNELEEVYNRKFNSNVRPANNGDHLELKDLNLKNLGITDVYKSQKDATWKIIQDDGGICDHGVGTGKTLIMCMAAHEMKRMGLKNKPMIIGMKANITQIAETYKRAYPNDKILFPGQNDFIAKNRENLLNSIKNNNWDCIILTHEQYKAIPQSPDIQKKVLLKELDDIEKDIYTQKKSTLSKGELKGLEKRKVNIEAKFNEINFMINKQKDNVLDFKKLGIDHILVDESQCFKNLMFSTRHNRVAGLGDQKGSQKATNLLYGIRTIQEKTGKDLGVTFLSGTTISNSLSEMYLLFKYLRPQHLEKQNIDTFDSWSAVFAKKSVDFEYSVTNQLIQKERFRSFVKVPELAKCYSEITDFRTANQIGLDKPELIEKLIHTPQTPDQESYSEKLKRFAQTGDATIVGRAPLTEKEQKSKMLIVTDLSKKMALDPRLVDPYAEDHPNSKLSNVARKINEFYQKTNEFKGTQLVFCDTSTFKKDVFTVYGELKRKLVEDYGIPAKEVQFIQDYNTQKQRDNLFKEVNDGKVRVLFGSTATLGTGVNVQKRVVAMHHVDIPWKPSETEQRNGRGGRTGNWAAKTFMNNKVENFVYAVEKTLDNYKFCINKNKEVFISQIKQCNLASRRIDEGGMDEKTGMSNLAEYVAITSGNTDLLEKTKLEKRITVLEGDRYNYNTDIAKARNRYESFTNNIAKDEIIIGKLKNDYKDYDSNKRLNDKGEVIPILQVNGKSDLKGAGEELVKAMEKVNSPEGQKVGTAFGFDIIIKTERYQNETGFIDLNKCFIAGEIKYQHNNGQPSMKPENIVDYPSKALEKIPNIIRDYGEDIEKIKKELPNLERYIKTEYPKEKEINELKKELKELEVKITSTLESTIKEPPLKNEETAPVGMVQEKGLQYGEKGKGENLGTKESLPSEIKPTDKVIKYRM